MSCPNCAHPAPDAWCPKCGQRQHPDGYGLKQILHGWLDVWLEPVLPIFRLPQLLIPPGAATSEFILGRRGRWPNPLAAYLGLLAFATAVLSLVSPSDALADVLPAPTIDALGHWVWILESLRVGASVALRYTIVVVELPILAMLARALLGAHPRGPSAPWVITLHAEIASLTITILFFVPLFLTMEGVQSVVSDPANLRLAEGVAGVAVLLMLPVLLTLLALWCGLAARRSYGATGGRAVAYALSFTATMVIVSVVALSLEILMQFIVLAAAVLLA